MLYFCLNTFVTLTNSVDPDGMPHHAAFHLVNHCFCLATDARLTADLGITSSIPARSNTFVVIDYEINSTVILLPSAAADSFTKGCFQLQAKVCARITG